MFATANNKSKNGPRLMFRDKFLHCIVSIALFCLSNQITRKKDFNLKACLKKQELR